MKKPKISFRVIGKSGPLSITRYPGPLGDAVEANNSIGVGFFAPNGEIMSVEFDDINEKEDHQNLKFDRHQVEVTVKNGKVSFQLKESGTKKNSQKKRNTNEAA
jgi:hypothetical protein